MFTVQTWTSSLHQSRRNSRQLHRAAECMIQLLGVTFRLKRVSPQYEDISVTQCKCQIYTRDTSNPRSSNIQSKKKRYLLAGRYVTSTRKHCNSFETWSLPSELILRMTAGGKNIESSKTSLFCLYSCIHI